MILFLDETGLRLIPFIGKTWALKGRENTPVFRHHGHWTKVSMIAAVSRRGKLFFQSQLADYDGPAVIKFLRHVMRTIGRRIMIVWDNCKIHKNRAVKEFLAENADCIEAHFLPPYAFELMPVEGFNSQLKVHELKNAAYANTADLQARVRRKARRIQRDRALCRSFWGQTPLT